MGRSFELGEPFHDLQVTGRCAYWTSRHVANAHSGSLGTGIPEKIHTAKTKKNALSGHVTIMEHECRARRYCANKIRLEITINSTFPLTYPEFQQRVQAAFIHFAEQLEFLAIPYDTWISSCKETLQTLDTHHVFNMRNDKDLELWQCLAFAHLQNRCLIADQHCANLLTAHQTGWKIQDQLQVCQMSDSTPPDTSDIRHFPFIPFLHRLCSMLRSMSVS